MGINQVQVRDNIGLSFAATLRSFLRQDPNIILVGEIRDAETASIGVKAALTGHLVLSTLHTNDAPSSVNRLVNMGIEPFLVANSLNLVAAQRLVRRICEHCKAPQEIPRPRLIDAGFTPEEAEATPADARPRLRSLQRHGPQGPRRALRDHGHHRRRCANTSSQHAGRPSCARVAIAEGMSTLRQTAYESPRGRDDVRGSRARNDVKDRHGREDSNESS